MSSRRQAGVLLALGVALGFSSCVQLTGQRISIRHDAEADELQVLLLYDGIHDGTPSDGKAQGQLERFVAQKDIMLFDWPLHFQAAKVAEAATDASLPAPLRELARRTTAQLKVEFLGTYTDGRGHTGAAQRVTITKAKEYLEALNLAIDAMVIDQAPKDTDPKWRLSRPRFLAAAKSGHAWVRLDGHALVFDLPFHTRELDALKGELLRELTHKDHVGSVVAAYVRIASMSGSWSESSRGLEVRMGRVEEPRHFGVLTAYQHETSLVPRLKELVGGAFAARFLPALLDAAADPAGLLALVPPEQQVLALVEVARGADADRAAKAQARLATFGKTWNETQGVPEAPVRITDANTYLADWGVWCRAMMYWPGAAPTAESPDP